MNKKELAVTEGNKIIAEFMGYTFGYPSENDLRDFIYHTSWDWLMPVVEKIKVRLNEEANYTLDYTIHFIFSIAGDKSANLEFHTITDLWEATVEYVKWHNKTFQTPQQ